MGSAGVTDARPWEKMSEKAPRLSFRPGRVGTGKGVGIGDDRNRGVSEKGTAA